MSRISKSELHRRWQAVRQAMKDKSLDFLIMQSSISIFDGNIKWFTDLSVNDGYSVTLIFPRDDEMITISHGPMGVEPAPRGSSGVKKGINVPMLPTLANGFLHAEKVVSELATYKNCRIGFVGMSLISAQFYNAVTKQLTSAKFEDATDLVDAIKVIKSDEEISFIRETCWIQDKIFSHLLAQVKPGINTSELNTEIIRKSLELGGDKYNIVVDPMQQRRGPPGPRVIQEGDQLAFLIETNGPSGYWGELSRTVCLGKISPELQEQFGVAQQAQKIALNLLKPGATPAEIWEANNAYLRTTRFGEERRIFAHGQGYDMVERPSLDLFETLKIQAGMNIVVHPEVKSEAARGWVCENYIVKASGEKECLHQTPQKIFVV